MAAAATSAMSSAFNAGKGRGSGPVVTTASPPTRTSNTPFRGFSALTLTDAAGSASDNMSESFLARVLNAFHDLQCSISTRREAISWTRRAAAMGRGSSVDWRAA